MLKLRPAIMASTMPSPGHLFGASGNTALIEAINTSLGSSGYFGSQADIFASASNAFITNIVQPIQRAAQMVTTAVHALVRPDIVRPLTNFEDFEYVPPTMQLGVIMYEPLLKLLEQGRIAGFGYDPAVLRQCEDVVGRLIDNGTVYDVLAAPIDIETRDIAVTSTYLSTDPDYSLDDIDAFETTRRTVDLMLAAGNGDPTDYPNERS